ncbi:MAG: DNA adenine methylase [Acutalibacteraceae bacterium]
MQQKRLNTDNFADIEARLDGVVIENKDFEDLIKVYDREKALFYCDPPYHKTERHYTVKFTEDDHERLCKSSSPDQGQICTVVQR